VNRYGPRPRGTGSYLPASYGRRENPLRFLTELGEQAEAEIEDKYLEYSGPDVPGESAEDKQAHLTQAMNRAAEEVFAELVAPSPASQGEPDPEGELPRRSSPHEFVLPARIRGDLGFTRGTPQTLLTAVPRSR
jgi:predicted RecB family nuclease